MALYWTTSGVCPGEGEISRFDFKDRVEAAARVGFKGIGIWHTELEHCMVHRSLQEMKRILDDNGMKHLELEFLTDWFVEGPRKGESDSRKKRLFEASAALHARHIKVGDFYNTPCPLARAAEAFARLCGEAEGFGATIGFEFMPSCMIHSLEDSFAMVEAAGARNGGVVLDIVHVMNLAIPLEKLRRMPGKRLVSVELNDGAPPGSPRHDPSGGRMFCGEGEYDIRGFIACVRDMGYRGPWAVEVFSREAARMPLEDLNRRAFETTMAQLTEA